MGLVVRQHDGKGRPTAEHDEALKDSGMMMRRSRFRRIVLMTTGCNAIVKYDAIAS